ncbi:MAG: hypothetical protein KDC95_03005 [Planctomycetes bacterium]|nr:hypothetical protein [Planctomycetota bacterium]
MFWTARFYYWSVTSEAPFADMRGYEDIARSLYYDFRTYSDPFWRTYWPPGVPFLRAGVMALFGPENRFAWRVFVALLSCVAASAFGREIALRLRIRCTAPVFVAFVGLSAPSIFWSYKVSTESVAEACLYGVLACFLVSQRTRSKASAICLGAGGVIAMLCRPNLAIGVAVLWATFVGISIRRGEGSRVFALVLTVIVCWAPWVTRNYVFYQRIVPLTTQAPFSFLSNVNGSQLRLEDGRTVLLDLDELQHAAPSLHANDAEASRAAASLVRSWLRQHPADYANELVQRLWHAVESFDIRMTKVPRRPLIACAGSQWLNAAWIDKSPRFLLAGCVGWVLAGALASPLFWVLLCAVIGSCGAALCFVGLPRMIEPMVPVLTFGVVSGAFALVSRVAHARARFGGRSSSHASDRGYANSRDFPARRPGAT